MKPSSVLTAERPTTAYRYIGEVLRAETLRQQAACHGFDVDIHDSYRLPSPTYGDGVGERLAICDTEMSHEPVAALSSPSTAVDRTRGYR